MGSTYYIRSAIQTCRAQLETEQKKLQELTNLQINLNEFSNKVNQQVDTFNQSVDARKNRVHRLSDFETRVKAVKNYSAKANNILTGTEYHKTDSQITEMLDKIKKQKKTTDADIAHTKQRIQALERELDRLHRELQIALAQEQAGAV